MPSFPGFVLFRGTQAPLLLSVLLWKFHNTILTKMVVSVEYCLNCDHLLVCKS